MLQLCICASEQNTQTRLNRGVCHGQKQELDKAIADYTAVIEMPGAPVDQIAKALVNRGVCHAQKQEVDKAIADYTAVIEMPGAPVDQIAKARFNRNVVLGRDKR